MASVAILAIQFHLLFLPTDGVPGPGRGGGRGCRRVESDEWNKGETMP